MENELETTMLYWGYTGIMENKMETTIVYSVQVMVDKACKVVVCGGGDGTVTSCSAASKIRVMVSSACPRSRFGSLLRRDRQS